MSFRTTRWSIVQAAAGGSSPEGRAALETLCATYWFPLYAFARRSGRDAHNAEDAVQGFLTHLITNRGFASARPDKGRFRSFLLAAFRYFMANEIRHAHAQKRGGGKRPLSLDASGAEERYQLAPHHDATPERLFDREWALTVLDLVMKKLEVTYVDNDKTALFAAIKDTLTSDTGRSYRERAEDVGMTEGAIKVAVHRLRKRYKELLEAEIDQTLGEQESTEDEIRALFRALGPV